jgi:hypothetical protein
LSEPRAALSCSVTLTRRSNFAPPSGNKHHFGTDGGSVFDSSLLVLLTFVRRLLTNRH